MVHTETITSTEVTLLEAHYRHAQCALIRERAHAVLLEHDGYRVPEIAGILRRHAETVRTWLHAFNQTRIASIFHHYDGNTNASKLTHEQKEEIRETLQHAGGETAIPSSFWTLPAFKEYLKASFGVVYESDRSYHYLLEYCGYSWKLPDQTDKRRKEDLVQQRMKEISSEITPLLNDPQWEVVAGDETKITYETEIRRAWCRQGIKTVIKTDRNKIHQSYFGALNLKTHMHHLIRLDWQDQEAIVHALKELVKKYPQKKICILWDNAPWHKGNQLRHYLGKGNALENIHLVALPPYAPDENPEEHVWKVGKEFISNQSFETFDELKNLFERTLSSRPFDYSINGI